MNSTRIATSGVLLAALLVTTGIARAADEQKFGRTLVTSYSIPRETLAEFNTLKAYTADPKLSTLENFAARPSKSWQATKAVEIRTQTNPYRIAIRFEGEVTGEQGAITLWSTGWFREGKMQTGDINVSSPLPGLNVSAADAKRSARVTRVGAGGPVSFRAEGAAFPTIDLNRLEGLKLDRVEVEVWSGIPEANWKEMLFSWRYAIGGLAMLALWFVWFRRRD